MQVQNTGVGTREDRQMTKKTACPCGKPALFVHYRQGKSSAEWLVKCSSCGKTRAGPYESRVKAQGYLIAIILER